MPVAAQLFCYDSVLGGSRNNWQTVSLFCMAEKIITTGTLAELKEMFPPAKVE
ncbi:hypothetical protein AAHB65_06425 [Bacillus toyonensis]